MGALANIFDEKQVVTDLVKRMRGRGAPKRLAIDLGVSYSHLVNIRNGHARIGEKVAAKLGYRMVWERVLLEKIEAEDHLLANKISRELGKPSKLKEADQ